MTQSPPRSREEPRALSQPPDPADFNKIGNEGGGVGAVLLSQESRWETDVLDKQAPMLTGTQSLELGAEETRRKGLALLPGRAEPRS